MTSEAVKADTIRAVLGKVFQLYVQTHCYHWNVEGPHFRSLHEMFETQYKSLNDSMDGVAERLRVLGVKAPQSATELFVLSNGTQPVEASTADEMLLSQCSDFWSLIETLRGAIQVMASVGDEGTVGVFAEILEWSEKEHWMMSVSKG